MSSGPDPRLERRRFESSIERNTDSKYANNLRSEEREGRLDESDRP